MHNYILLLLIILLLALLSLDLFFKYQQVSLYMQKPTGHAGVTS